MKHCENVTGWTIACSVVSFLVLPALRNTLSVVVHGAESLAVVVDYPRAGSIFPPEIAPPTFLWRDNVEGSREWRIDFRFADGTSSLHFESHGEPRAIGAIDSRCISATNRLPELSPIQAAEHSWKPDAEAWEKIKKYSTVPATIHITGYSDKDGDHPVSSGSTTIQTSSDPVGAPIFYRDVPLMPAETEKGVISPLPASAKQLIAWKLRSIDQPQSHTVLEGMHTCANCHSFSRDGRTMGIDMDGPANDKGLYAVVPVEKQTIIRVQDMVNWNPSGDRQFSLNRLAFMSQVSPDGKYVLTMMTPSDRAPENNYFVANFKDYRFLQVFYPTRGILVWLDRATGERRFLPGADDPRYVQTDGVWSPDGKYVVFARAEAKDPYPPGQKSAAYANDPNEIKIQYDLYRVPFNDGRGGVAEPIAGASANGMSNSFPKVSPDGRWIVFVKCRNAQLMRPDSELYIVPSGGGVARRLNANLSPMNSWHSWSPNGRWLVFSSKGDGPYTKMYLTHIDESGNDSPAILIEDATAANRAVNLPEFVNIPSDGLLNIATPAVDIYKRFDHANDLADKGDNAGAIAEWNAIMAEQGDDDRVLSNLGTVLLRIGKYEEAVQHFKKALEMHPDFSSARANLAYALVEAGRASEAVPEYKIALAATPDSALLHNNYGIALARLDRQRAAAAEFEKAIAYDSSLADAHNNLGTALLADGWQDRAAEAEFQRAIALQPHFAEAENNLGVVYLRRGANADAERHFRLAVAADGRMVRAWVNLGSTLVTENRSEEARDVVAKALEIDPMNEGAHALQAIANTNPK
jgi:Tfp pilus assembly protein PilF